MKSFASFNHTAQQRIHSELVGQQQRDNTYISELETHLQELQRLLQEHDIEAPPAPRKPEVDEIADQNRPERKQNAHFMEDGSPDELKKVFERIQENIRLLEVKVQFRSLTFWNMASPTKISTVGSYAMSFVDFLFESNKKYRVNILNDLTGRIKPRALTLVMGPPGSGKSVLLKLLAGQLNKHGGHVEGDILYNGDKTDSGNFLLPKVADYIDEKEIHAPTLTVKETVEFAWQMTTGGHHSYATAKDAEAAAKMDEDDNDRVKLQNILKFLGIAHVSDTIVGDGMLRGVSGGQKRRVTVAEMLIPPRMIKFMDSISTGLDSSTTFDIIRSLKFASMMLGYTAVISLLQPAPEVFELFDELILLDQGQIIYHGPIEQVVPYFEGLGYRCPADMDVADFLQELPTSEGKRFMFDRGAESRSSNRNGDEDDGKAQDADSTGQLAENSDAAVMDSFAANMTAPRGSKALAAAWKASLLYAAMLEEMQESCRGEFADHQWPEVFRERYAGSNWFMLQKVFSRQLKVTLRDMNFLKGRVAQAVIVGSIAGSLFSDLDTNDVQTMAGILFFAALNCNLTSMSMLPIVYSQRQVFNKHQQALFFPAHIFVVCQSVVLIPLIFLETILFSVIVYWAVGLTDENDGANFFIFIFLLIVQGIASSQLITLIASVVPLPVLASPIAGVATVLMVLFSGYILPADDIPPGWIWFYWLNPIAYSIKGFFINELTAEDYDNNICTRFSVDAILGIVCTKEERFGDVVLDNYGYPEDRAWIWYGVAIVAAEYFLFLLLTGLVLQYLQPELKPPPPDFVDLSEVEDVANTNGTSFDAQLVRSMKDSTVTPAAYGAVGGSEDVAEASTISASAAAAPKVTVEAAGSSSKKDDVQFDPVTLSFEEVWYTVTMPSGEELDLLKGVSGFFEPYTLTALMGTSGAGKTTLLDVLAGRKNTGVIKGLISVNGKKKDEEEFRHINGYVEQFDTLSPNDTAREAIEFSAALRLPRGTSARRRAEWVNYVLVVLELQPLEQTLCGTMSFEQRKRVSIGLELAANPAILFLDEPTSGLDSRSSQVVIRCIQRVAATGRSIVCTIHQPSKYIFDSFDSLLLLRRGGQTVYFGELGTNSARLLAYFESVPGVDPMPARSKAASWMLELVSPGASSTGVDFHEFYKRSALCSANSMKVTALCHPHGSDNGDDANGVDTTFPMFRTFSQLITYASAGSRNLKSGESKYNASYSEQFQRLMLRFMRTYWRSPSYNFVRMVISIVIALIFSSTYVNDKYSSSSEVIARVALIFVTTLFIGVVTMMTVQSVVFADRPAYYREKFSELYDVKLYVLAATLIEIPYLIVSTLLFLVPYFFIVGFDQDGTTVKFFWYWLYMMLYVTTCVFLGNLIACATPDEATAQVVTGMLSTVISLFCGFMIKLSDMPNFWIFMYWLDPLHYAMEGLVVTQFNRDDTELSQIGTPVTVTASTFIADNFEDWEYKNRVLDAIALLIFIVAMRVLSYLFLEYVRHDKR